MAQPPPDDETWQLVYGRFEPLTPVELRVRKVSHRGRVREWALNPLWVTLDKTTIEGMLRASRSGDPRQRAEAARRARDAVARRLEQLRKKRALIEARARQLRRH